MNIRPCSFYLYLLTLAVALLSDKQQQPRYNFLLPFLSWSKRDNKLKSFIWKSKYWTAHRRERCAFSLALTTFVPAPIYLIWLVVIIGNFASMASFDSRFGGRFCQRISMAESTRPMGVKCSFSFIFIRRKLDACTKECNRNFAVPVLYSNSQEK